MAVLLLIAPIYLLRLTFNLDRKEKIRKKLILSGKTAERDNRVTQLKEIFENLKVKLPCLLFHFIFVMKRQIVVLSLILM